MAGIQRIKGQGGAFREMPISSLAFVVNDIAMYDFNNNIVIKATSSATPERIAGIVVAASTTSDTVVLVQKIAAGDEFSAETGSNTAASMDLERMSLTDENTVNNSGSDQTDDTGVFQQLGVIGAAGDQLIRGQFVTIQDRAA